MKQVIARVVSNGSILPGGPHYTGRALSSYLMQLHCPEIAGQAKPGQFIMVRCGERTLPRPFSIHRVDNKGNLALFYAVLEGGKGTHWLSQRQKNDTVELFGLLGNGFSIQSGANNLLLVAGGIGITPLYFLAQQALRWVMKQAALRRERSVILLYGTVDKNRYPNLPRGIELVSTTEDGSVGEKGRVTDLLPEFVDWADQIFACGPPAMYRTMANMPELRDKPVQVSLETRMGCGYGVCYGCTIKTKGGLKQVCKDGPVFNLDDILWTE